MIMDPMHLCINLMHPDMTPHDVEWAGKQLSRLMATLPV